LSSGGLVSLFIDGVLYDSRPLEIAGGEQAATTWELPSSARLAEVRLEPAEGSVDHLSQDNRAWVVLNSSSGKRVLLASEGNLFLERMLNILPGYEIVHRLDGPGATEAGEERFDIYIYDGVALPESLPQGSILIFDPQEQPSGNASEDSVALIQATGIFTNTSVAQVSSDELLTDVDWQSVNVSEARQVAGEELTPIVGAEGGPLLLAGEVGGRRVVLFTFDLHKSDLPLQVAFPIIMSNVFDWLAPGTANPSDSHLQPGDTVSISPDERATEVVVEYPDGSTWKAQPGSTFDPPVFGDTNQVGPYSITYLDDEGSSYPLGSFAVNFMDSEESTIQPGDASGLVTERSANGMARPTGFQELWPWFLGVALLVLMIEWWATYGKRVRRSMAPHDSAR
jgi:hypothetical protein